MSSRLTLLAAVAIAGLAFGATTAFARGSHGGMSGGMHGGMHGSHVGGFHGHGHFFFGGVGYVPYAYTDYDDDDESCPLVRRRVATNHGLRWRWVRGCAY